MKKLIALLLCLTILAVPVSALAAPIEPKHPFGEEMIPLSADEMEQVDGEWQGIAIAGVVGAAYGAYNYLTTTPRNEWTWGGTAINAFNGAVGMVVGGYLGTLF